MEQQSRKLLGEAVSALIEDSDARQMFTQLSGVLELKRQRLPVALTGRPAILNPLLDLAIEDPDTYGTVLDLIDTKRALRGLEVLVVIEPEPEPEPDADRKAYMREFMAIKRERQRRLIELLNELRSDVDKIKGTARMELERIHAARWLDEKDRREYAMRKHLGRRLTIAERKSVSTQLWADVDAELDALEEFVRLQLHLPLSQRTSSFNFRVGKPKEDT